MTLRQKQLIAKMQAGAKLVKHGIFCGNPSYFSLEVGDKFELVDKRVINPLVKNGVIVHGIKVPGMIRTSSYTIGTLPVEKIEESQPVGTGRATCPECKRKGVGYAGHPHASGHKDYDHATCRFCRCTFRTVYGEGLDRTIGKLTFKPEPQRSAS